MKEAITPRKKDFSQWYLDVIKKADLIENTDVRGCMTLKPYGYAIWEKIKGVLDEEFKKTGHQNAYFPLLIPKSYFNKEASHVEGFAKECAVVTHHRLKISAAGTIEIDEEAKLKEELVIRPTSETIIWNSYKNWIHSYRDLPLLINQWCNVMRWEMRNRPFLRSSEILWQEGHTAHETKEEALAEAEKMLEIYFNFGKDYLAIPFFKGIKTETEKFAGAEITYSIEAIMQDGKALQCGTSHFLGQNFSKAFDVKFANKNGALQYVWGTSWGVTTRLIGAVIMTHSDDEGLVLPPNIAPIQVVMIPIYKSDDEKNEIEKIFINLKNYLTEKNITAKIDNRENISTGWKYNKYEAEGVPIRIVMGPKDFKNNSMEVFRRDTKEKKKVSILEIHEKIVFLLSEIQKNLYERAKKMKKNMTFSVDAYEDFKAIISEQKGCVYAHWNGDPEVEKTIAEETKATIRCIPLDDEEIEHKEGKCIFSNEISKKRVIFAKSY